MATRMGAASAAAEKQTIQDRFTKQIDQARQRVSTGFDSARQRVGSIQEQATDIWDDALDYIRENPGKVIAVALGIGLAVGMLLRPQAEMEEEEEYAE